MQNFKVTYKKTLPAIDPKNALLTQGGLPMKLFTIQTEDGKYLATDGLPSNGSRLTTQGTEFLWWIYCDELGFPKVNIMVPGANSKTPTLPTKHNHGGYIASYPAKTTYKVGQGFDSTGFKMMYLDGNNGWKTKDATANYKLYTSDGVELTQGRPFMTTGTKIVEIVQNTGRDWAHRTVRGRYFITVTK